MSSAPRRRRGPLLPLLLVAALGIALAGGLTWRELFAAPPPVQPANTDTIEPDVLELLQERIEAVRAEAGSARAHASLGLAYEANRFWAEAEASFANAAELEPEQPLWRFHQAIARHNQGDLPTALAGYEALLEELGDSAALHHRLGDALLAAGRTDEALARFEKVIELVPDLPEGWAGRGAARLRQEDFAAAAEDLERALMLDDRYRSAHYLLGLAYRGLGRGEEAKRALRRGMDAKVRYLPDELEDELRSYAVSYGKAMERVEELVADGRLDDALRRLEAMFKRRQNDVHLLERLEDVYRKAGRHEDAASMRRRIESLIADGAPR